MQTFYRTNNSITAKEVRLLGSDGTQIGILSIDEARNHAREQNTDLVEIAPMATPPVVKLIDFKKFKYQLAKKEQEEKRKQKGGDLKEVLFTPYMAENDFQHRMNRVIEFLGDNNKVRLVVKFKNIQLSHKEFGYELLKKAADLASNISTIDQQPKMLGRQIFMTLTPAKNRKVPNSTSENTQ